MVMLHYVNFPSTLKMGNKERQSAQARFRQGNDVHGMGGCIWGQEGEDSGE